MSEYAAPKCLPVPPGETHFYIDVQGEWRYKFDSRDERFAKHLVACALRCAWLDEAFKLRQKCLAEDRMHPRYGVEDEPEEAEEERCLENAEAWRKWGEEK